MMAANGWVVFVELTEAQELWIRAYYVVVGYSELPRLPRRKMPRTICPLCST
jgi:hypothetical protein